ncbi:MAG: DEAD/DEAH box helicase [Haloarculaceae archaeon]
MAAIDADGDELDHPLLAPGVLERREYQLQLAEAALRDHTLVCLPTGLGKTTVSLLVTAHRLHDAGGRALLLAPTKPLVQQHATFYREALAIPDDEVVVFTGEVSPDDRRALWETARVVIATPQVVENDLVGSRISLSDVTHVTFDECHRATGDYAYNYIAGRYHADASEPLATGMSASPGGDEEAILQVCENLGLREVEVMTEADADVAEHTYDTDVEWIHLDLPEEVIEIRDALTDVIADRLAKLKEIGVTSSTSPELSQRDLNEIRGRLRELMDNDQSEGYTGMSIHAEVMKLRRAVELVETQSVESLRRYFERQRNAARTSGASKASQRFVSEPRVEEAMRRAEAYDDLHPKFRRTRMLLAETLGIEEGERVIVFTESRDTAESLTEFLSNHFETRRFVGQGDKEGSDGMSQAEQQETLDAFRDGEFEVLVSTSVAEEGLDVPDVDLVLFYEPVPKGIRSIQRKGRTGRAREGRVVVLIANDTRDEAFFWMSRREENRMEEELRDLKDVAGEIEARLTQEELASFEAAEAADGAATGDDAPADDEDDTADAAEGATADAANETDGQTGLDAFAAPTPDDVTDADGSAPDDGVVATASPDDEAVEIVVDQRELDARIARDLSTRDGVRTRLETLQVGDYVLSDRVAVERKTVADFLDTLLGGDRSLFEQLRDATRHYARPVVILEGTGLYEERNVHPNAIRGALASIAVDFGASVMQTADEDETADLLETIARREQQGSDREVTLHGEKSAKTLREQQEYVVAAIAEVGPVTARALLRDLGSVEAVMTAERERLLEVEGVGPVTADRVREVVGSDYDD